MADYRRCIVATLMEVTYPLIQMRLFLLNSSDISSFLYMCSVTTVVRFPSVSYESKVFDLYFWWIRDMPVFVLFSPQGSCELHNRVTFLIRKEGQY